MKAMSTSHSLVYSIPMLTAVQQQQGRKTLLWFGLFNSLSFTLVTGNMISLYLLRLGASTALIGVVASFVYLSFFFLVPGRFFVPRVGVMRLFAWAWFLRYMAILPILVAPLFVVTGQEHTAFFLVAAGVFLFQVIRGMGIVANTPMFTGFASQANRGHFISQFQMIAAVVSIVTGTLIAVLLGPDSTVGRYLLFLGAGIVFGLVGAGLLFTLPELEDYRESARKPMGAMVRSALRDSQFRHFLRTFFIIAVTTGIGRSFMVLFAKQAYDFSDSMTFFMLALGNVGTFIAGYLGSVLLDRLGARPLIIFSLITFLVGLVIAVFVLPVAGPIIVPLMAVVFLCTAFGFTGGENSFQAYFFGLTPPEERLDRGILYFFTLGAGGTLGAVVGGYLIGILELVLPLMRVYQIFFIGVSALLIGGLLLIQKLPTLGAEPFRDTLGVIFSLRDLRAVTFVSKLEQSTTVAEERTALRSLSSSPSDRVVESLIERISSPSYAVRVDALDAIQERPLTRAVEAALITHLSVGHHTTASRAARILGLKGSDAAVEPLRRCLHSDDALLAGRAAIALCRLGDKEALPTIRAMLTEPHSGTTVLYAAAALQIGGTEEDIVLLLDVALHRTLPEYVTDEVILSLAALFGFNDWFYPRYVHFTQGHAVDDVVVSEDQPPLPGGLTWPEQEVSPRVRFLMDAYTTWKKEAGSNG